MQTTSVLVTLSGGSSMIVPKNGVTVAEYMVLAASHGIDSVKETSDAERGQVNVKHAEEYARLAQVYSPDDVAKCFGPSAFNVKMPTRFFDIGVGADEPEPLPEKPADKPPAAPAAELKLDGKAGK